MIIDEGLHFTYTASMENGITITRIARLFVTRACVIHCRPPVAWLFQERRRVERARVCDKWAAYSHTVGIHRAHSTFNESALHIMRMPRKKRDIPGSIIPRNNPIVFRSQSCQTWTFSHRNECIFAWENTHQSHHTLNAQMGYDSE